MNHRPFEDWLLDDQPLNPQQLRGLQEHLRTCTACSAIAESNMALHTTHLMPPVAGFTDRFAVRLAKRRQEQQLRQIIGTIVLVLGGIGLSWWLVGASLQEALRSPADWITTAVGYLLFVVTSFHAASEAGAVLLRVVPTFIPPAGWFVVSLIAGGLGLAWGLSIRRLEHTPQGV